MWRLRRSVYVKAAIIVLLFVGVALSERSYETHARKAVPPQIAFFSTQVIRASDFGLHAATASFMWLDFIQHVGQPGAGRGAVTILRAVTDLDPHFSYPYAFGVLVLPALDPVTGRADALEIGTKALALGIIDWRIPFYLAADFHDAHDTPNALKYFAIAANTPGIPDAVRTSALSYGTQKDNRARTKIVWQSIYDSSNDEVVMERAKAHLVHIGILETLDSAVALYKKQHGRFPKDLQALVDAKILQRLPEDPLGFTYSIEPGGVLQPKLK